MFSTASNAALPSAAPRLPGAPPSPYAFGCSGCGDQYARVPIVSRAWSSVGRWVSDSCWGVSAAAMADQLLIEPGGDVRTELE
ncbi:hypothetical protein SCYAM73S_01913 [Streptomyces cyaneofuscatus]